MGAMIEQVVGFNLPELTPAVSRFAGKVDLYDPKAKKIIDYKTVSDIDAFTAGRHASFQLELYALALKHKGQKVEAAEYRLVQKPALRPSKADLGANGLVDYGKYEDRCFEWLGAEPGRFTVLPVPITDSISQSALQWVFSILERIKTADAGGTYISNPSACFSYQSACPYMALCRCRKEQGDIDAVVSTMFRQRGSRHKELVGPEYNDAATNSELETFSQCEAKWLWKYGRLLDPIDEVKGESLLIGDLVHRGVDLVGKGQEGAALRLVNEWCETSLFSPGAKGPEHVQTIAAKSRAIIRKIKEVWYA